MKDNKNEIFSIINIFTEKYSGYLTNMDKYGTQLEGDIAEISALTKKLSAKRELVNIYFSNHLKEKEQLYNISNKVLDKAISTGSIEMAEIALEQIKIIQSIK